MCRGEKVTFISNYGGKESAHKGTLNKDSRKERMDLEQCKYLEDAFTRMTRQQVQMS